MIHEVPSNVGDSRLCVPVLRVSVHRVLGVSCDMRTLWPQAASGEVQVGDQEKVLHWKSGQALAQAAQGSGGVPIPGEVQTPCGCGTWGHGLAGVGVLG